LQLHLIGETEVGHLIRFKGGQHMQPMAACMEQGGNDDSLGYGIRLVTLTASVNRSFIDMRAYSKSSTGLSFT
jgi:hypothetical protein